jgi:selenoprotein W-related protein
MKRTIATVELCRFFLYMRLSIQCIHVFGFGVMKYDLKLSQWRSNILRHPDISATSSLRRVNFSNVFPTLSAKVSKDSNNDLLPRVSIEYCTGCKWMLRAAWLSQELLTTFQDELHSVSLVPSKPPAPAGTFLITLNDDITIWSRKDEGRFPEAKEVKQRIRDVIQPDKSLGHSDTHERKAARKTEPAGGQNGSDSDPLRRATESNEIKDSLAILSFEQTVQYSSSSSSSVTTSPSIGEEKCSECNDERKEMIRKMQMQFKDLDDDDAMEMKRYFGVW